MEQPHPNIQKDEIWCPVCKAFRKFLSVRAAAEVASVNRRSIYRYIENGDAYSLKVVGKTFRVCGGCLLRRG